MNLKSESNNEKNKVNQIASREKAITLLALVVIIIILLILAGITVNAMMTGDGILSHALIAKEQTEISDYIERIELSRTVVALNNFGKVTIDNLIEQIYLDQVVPRGNIKKLNESRAKVTTVEGYVFIITGDGVDYVEKEENIATPDLEEGMILFQITSEGWTNQEVEVNIIKNAGENLILEYSLDRQTWNTYTATLKLTENKMVYARYVNEIGEDGSYSSVKVNNIDKISPIEFIPTIMISTDKIKIDASDAKDGEETEQYGKSGIKEIWYSKDNGATWQTNEDKTKTTYEYTGLVQNQKHYIQVKVIDNAGNQIITKVQEVTTNSVAEAIGNVKINIPTWDVTTHKAYTTIEKEVLVSSEFSIQYQVVTDLNDITEPGWTIGTTVTNLSLNSYVCARLWDGKNGGEYTNIKVTDEIVPTVTVRVTTSSTNSITVSANSSDEQSGMPMTPTYTYYIKKTGEVDTTYVQKHSGTNGSYQFTDLLQKTDYTIKVTAADNAGNVGTGIVTKTTGTVTIATGNLTIATPTWNATTHKASTTITKGSSVSNALTVQYQVVTSLSNVKETGWTTGTSVSNLNLNDYVCARLWDGKNGGDYTSVKVADGTKPTVTVSVTTSSTNSITVSASSSDAQSGMPASITYTYYIKKTSESDTTYVQKHSGTNTNYQFTDLLQKTDYTIKVTATDNAGNVGTGIVTKTTGTVTIATGNLTIATPTWNATTHKASTTITKRTSVSNALTVQYQVVTSLSNITETGWTTGTSVSNLNLNDYVCARLWDGKNGGDYASVKVTDGTVPQVATISLSGTNTTTTGSVTATVTLIDNQSGVSIKNSKWIYNTTSTAIGITSSNYTNSFSTNSQTLTLKSTTPGTYYLHVLTQDNAGNKKETISNPIEVKQLVTGITLSKTSMMLTEEDIETITATITPTNASNKNITWSSNNASVATVSGGKITAVSAGTAMITATAQDGSGKSVSCTVTVEAKKTVVKFKPGDYVQYDGGNGYTGLWQVLYNDELYGLQIISSSYTKRF